MFSSLQHIPARVMACRLALCAALAVPLLVLYIDLPLAQYIAANRPPYLKRFFDFTNHFGESNLWIMAGLVIMLLPRLKKRLGWIQAAGAVRQYALIAFYMWSSLLASSIVVRAVKILLGRHRPTEALAAGMDGYSPFSINFVGKFDSFPSGHAQTICSVMTVLWFLFPRHRALCVVTAFLVCIGRVVNTRHFIGDVAAGAAIGIISALVLKKLFEKRYGLLLDASESPPETQENNTALNLPLAKSLSLRS